MEYNRASNEQPQNLVKDEVAAGVGGELGDALDGELGGIVEVVDDGDVEAAVEELEDGVAADVAGAAGDQNVLRHGRGWWCCSILEAVWNGMGWCRFAGEFIYIYRRE